VKNLRGVEGVNISVHHYDLERNREITGLYLIESVLQGSIMELNEMGASVRMNCNCIRGYIDNAFKIQKYIRWARNMYASKVRFAELKHASGGFVDLAGTLDGRYGTNYDPFREGCSNDAVIEGMPVNFRQMCGMQTSSRPCPENPEIIPHPVLYYNGKLYDGWQQKRETDMTAKELIAILEDVKANKVSVTEAALIIDRAERGEQDRVRRSEPEGGGSCLY